MERGIYEGAVEMIKKTVENIIKNAIKK